MIICKEAPAPEIIPFAEDDMMIIEAEKYALLTHNFFITVNIIGGGFLLSKDFLEHEIAAHVMEYRTLARHFGGGYLTLYEVGLDEQYICFTESVF